MKDREGLFQSIVSSLIDGILLVSPELNILKSNPALEEMFRRSGDSFQGQPLSELFPDQPGLIEKVEKTSVSGSAYLEVEGQGLRKSDGLSFPVNLTLSPFLDAEGQITGVVLLVKDMSFVRELQEASRHMDHLSTLGELSLGMAHEIRNPLGGIRGSAQLLLEELQNPEHREYLEVVISEVDRINRMVTRMMGFTDTKELVIGEINIHQLLDDILLVERESLASKHINVDRIYDPSLPPIEADEDRLKQVFINLIKNALEASPEKGRIRLVTRLDSAYTVKKPRDKIPRHNIIVEVIDSGVGIDESLLDHLFTPFYTTKPKGSGLGLPISLKIVENHGGNIKLRSKKGEGTTALVFLPIRQR